jgi:hypothetical protein
LIFALIVILKTHTLFASIYFFLPLSDYKDIANEMCDELANDVEKTINKNAKKKKPTFLIMGIAAFGLLLICACLLIASIHIRTNAAKESYNTAKNEASNIA